MLLEISIANFAIIDALTLGVGPHFDVFTGETGAGKSILVDAISALVGERMPADVVRAGSDRAVVEGIFDVSRLLAQPSDDVPGPRLAEPTAEDDAAGDEAGGDSLRRVLAELGLEAEDNTLILTREILASGRGLARINRRAVPLSALQRIARFLIDIHGQSAHLELLRPDRHIFYLDRYAGVEDLRGQVAQLVAEWRAARRELERLRQDEREIERRVELLRFQVDEIEAARLVPGELDDLEVERRRLSNAERLGELSAAVHAALAGDSDTDEVGALDLLARAQRSLSELLRLDDSPRDALNTLEQATYLAQDAADAVRSYADEIAADPARQAEVEDRLTSLSKLRRKYGATIEEILAYAEESATELDGLTHREERMAELQARDVELKARIGTLATQLSERRRAASERLSSAMERELNDLNMRRARFQVGISQRHDPGGVPVTLASAGAKAKTIAPTETFAFTATGIDQVEFLIAPNPGEPFKPLVRIASGGETSRMMLALKTILSNADIVPILIFDEIDSGISGRSGQVVGEKLWQLGQSHQVLCVTHLPQIAALGDCHFRVAKAAEADRTITQVEDLTDQERVAELSQMLGGASTAASRANATELLERAAEWKRNAQSTMRSA